MSHRKWEYDRDWNPSHLVDEHNALFEAWQKAESDAARLGKSNDEMCDEIAELRRWKTETLDENNRLDRELDEARQRVKRLEADVRQAEANSDKWSAERDAALARVAKLEDERDTLRAQLDDLQYDHSMSYKLREIIGLTTGESLTDAVRRLVAELAALRQPGVPVKVRFNVTAHDVSRKVYGTSGSECTSGVQEAMNYLATHAVINVPPGVPSVDELGRLADKVYCASVGNIGGGWMERAPEYRKGIIDAAAAIRDRVLAGVAVSQGSLAGVAKHMMDQQRYIAERDEARAERDKLREQLAAAAPPTDAQVEALARVLCDNWRNNAGDGILDGSYDRGGCREEWINCARAAFAHIGAVPEPLADADTLEKLAEIARKAYKLRPNAPEGQQETWPEVVAAILRAAKARVDVTADELSAERGRSSEGLIDWLNCRIRFGVEVPPVGVWHGPTRAEAEAKWKELAQHGNRWAYAAQHFRDWLLPRLPESRTEGLPSIEQIQQHMESVDVRVDHGSLVKLIAYLAPWLRDPVGWEFGFSTDDLQKALEDFFDSSRPLSECAAVLMSDIRSRIRPVFECQKCARRKELGLADSEDLLARINAARAALEGE